MSITTQHYIEYLFPGIMPESKIEPVDTMDPLQVVPPENCFGFRFFDQEVYEPDVAPLFSRPQPWGRGPENISKMYFLGRLMTLEEVKTELPTEKLLISYMVHYRKNVIVKTNCPHFYQPFEEWDIIL